MFGVFEYSGSSGNVGDWVTCLFDESAEKRVTADGQENGAKKIAEKSGPEI